MTLGRFFCPELAGQGERFDLPEDEAHHALKSLRAKAGAELTVFDGDGREAAATAIRIRGREVQIERGPIRQYPFDLRYRITLATAMPRAHRQNYLVEKCTELGVAAIWPTITERSVAKSAGSAKEKLKRRAIEAAKQSQRRWVPTVASPRPFRACLERCADFDVAVLTDGDAAHRSLVSFLADQAEHTSLLVFVGPEGGWTDGERAQALQAGVHPVTLSPTVLRVETAAVCVCAAAAMRSV